MNWNKPAYKGVQAYEYEENNSVNGTPGFSLVFKERLVALSPG